MQKINEFTLPCKPGRAPLPARQPSFQLTFRALQPQSFRALPA